MNKVFYLFKVLWAYWYFFVFAVIFILLLPLFAILLSREKWHPQANALRVFWAHVLFLFTGLIFKPTYKSKIDQSRVYVVCSNHFSYLDIPISALVVRRNWKYMAKMEIENIPILNIFFRKLDISVNRENARHSFRSWKVAADSIDEGYNIVIYPEGTIGPHPPSMVRFKNGPFRLAIDKQVPILPVSVLDNWHLLVVDGWKMYGHPGVSRVIVHSPIETKGMTFDDLEMLKQKVFSIIDEGLKNGN